VGIGEEEGSWLTPAQWEVSKRKSFRHGEEAIKLELLARLVGKEEQGFKVKGFRFIRVTVLVFNKVKKRKKKNQGPLPT